MNVFIGVIMLAALVLYAALPGCTPAPRLLQQQACSETCNG